MLLFSALSLLGQIGVLVALPLYANAIQVGPGADPYFVLLSGSVAFTLFFGLCYLALVATGGAHHAANKQFSHKDMVGVGVFTSFNGLLVVFASPTNRTGAFLQALLSNIGSACRHSCPTSRCAKLTCASACGCVCVCAAAVPLTIAFRYLVLRKSINVAQFVCAAAVVLGIFIALIPTLTGASDDPSAATGIGRIVWPIIFMVGFAPAALMNVLTERGLKETSGKPRAGGKSTRSSMRGSVTVATLAPAMLAVAEEADDEEEEGEEGEHPPAGLLSPVPESPDARSETVLLLEKGEGGAPAAPAPAGQAAKFGSGSTVSIGSLASRISGGRPGRRKVRVDVMYFLFWTNLYQVLSNAALFWADLIPGFGMATGFDSFFTRFKFGFACVAGIPAECDASVGTAATLFMVSYCVAGLGTALLSRHPEGASLVALVQTLTTPLAGIWWTLFVAQPFHWHPVWTTSTWYSLGGMLLMVPGIGFFNYYGEKPAGH